MTVRSKTYRLAAGAYSFAGKRGWKKEREITRKKKRRHTLRASSSLCAFSESPCKDKTNARDNDASRIYAAGPSNSRDLCSRIKATTTHAAALSFARSVFTNEFVHPLNVLKFCDFLAGGPPPESTGMRILTFRTFAVFNKVIQNHMHVN